MNCVRQAPLVSARTSSIGLAQAQPVSESDLASGALNLHGPMLTTMQSPIFVARARANFANSIAYALPHLPWRGIIAKRYA